MCRTRTLPSTTMKFSNATSAAGQRIMLWLSACVILCVLTACANPGGPHPTSAAVAHTGAAAQSVTDGGYTLTQEPQAGYSSVVDLINSVTKSFRIAIYELSARDIEDALIAAHHRDVDVRVLMDQAFHGKKTNQRAYEKLTAAGVGVKWAPPGRILHEKAWVADDSTAYVATANLNDRYFATSRDAIIRVTDKSDVAAIAATFDSDYAQAESGRFSQATTGPHLVWSPAARNIFIRTITSAHKSIELTTEVLKDHPVAIALSQAVQQSGVVCRIILNSDQRQSQAVDQVQRAGCQIHYIATSKTGLYLHEKLLIADGGDAGADIGSTNLSTMSLVENRELSLHLDNAAAPKLIAAVEDQFNEDYANAAA